MVSSSKPNQKKPPSKDKPESHVRLQKGDKPLARKKFYLDLKNHTLAGKLEARIKDLGGTVEVFLVETVSLVVSDRYTKTERGSRKWGYSGGSGGPPSLRSVEVQTPTRTPPTPSLNGECPLSNSTNTRGQTAQRIKSRVDAMLERALTQPQKCSVDPLDNAQSWGIPIWTTEKFKSWLEKIYLSLRDTGSLRCVRKSAERDFKVKEFKKSFIKFESFKRETRPVFLELPLWPTLNFDGEAGTCPFDRRRREEKKRDETDSRRDMTRRPRATATRARRSEQLVAGYCEICRIDYRDLSKHVESEKHLAFVKNDDNFLSLDTLINSGASVEAFLKLNQSDDVGQDLFTNGSDKLHGVVIRGDKVEKTVKSDINDFDVDDLKMVQCNGARRKLNLKLSSPHNLRTRAKHESGHLLRSKGSPWHEVDKSDKFYDKFDGFTIKKRSKGTIWIEEDDPPSKCVENETNEAKSPVVEEKSPLSELNDARLKNKDSRNQSYKKTQLPRVDDRKDKRKDTEVEQNHPLENGRDKPDAPVGCKAVNGDCRLAEVEAKLQFNGSLKPVVSNHSEPAETPETREDREDAVEEASCKARISEAEKEDRPKAKPKRGTRSTRTRQRLSVEERLIEDNRAYYKVEVLGNKLRSSTTHWNNSTPVVPAKEAKEVPEEEETKKDDEPSSEKPVVVRFKRVRKSELSLLSDEAESFMFGDSRRDESTDASESEDNSSVLPPDTESECDGRTSSVVASTPATTPVKQEADEDSQDSTCLGRARKRRRTQAEALIMDNADYYKFETPGSRLRFQCQPARDEPVNDATSPKAESEKKADDVEKLYPSKPSAEVEKMRFSFESVPKSEPWFQTYQRQDEGAEFWHFFSESDTRKPFLLPYEIENFHENLLKLCQKSEARKKSRVSRGPNGFGRSPRKSPRCHASTLAIMSTIIRKREQQSQTTSGEDEARSRTTTPKPDKLDKSSTDLELQKIVRSIDDMLNADVQVDESFEVDAVINEPEPQNPPCSRIPGAPENLLDLLDNCHQHVNGIENSSCASSECGEVVAESPLKRRKRRKNRTGWPGNKIRRRLQIKPAIVPDVDSERENLPAQPHRQQGGEEEEDDDEEEEDEEDEEDCDLGRVKCERKPAELPERPPSKCEPEKTSNDENHENVFRNDHKSSPSKQHVSKLTPRRRQRDIRDSVRPSSSETIDPHFEIENDDSYRKKNPSTIISRKNYTINKRRPPEPNESKAPDIETESSNVEQSDSECAKKDAASKNLKKLPKSRKRQRKSTTSDTFENDCKKDIDSEVDCPLSERISPAPQPAELQQRRSSIEFQPVVRVMKIDDQVDMDHSILSVTVASNRRLRSSSSPRSNVSPPVKRYKRSKGPFGRWMKNS